MAIYISLASAAIGALALALNFHQWKTNGGRPKVTIHYGVLSESGYFMPCPWPFGQRDSFMGKPVLAIHVYNRGRGELNVQWVNVSGTRCGDWVAPINVELPLTISPHTIKAIYFSALPAHMGAHDVPSIHGRQIRANLLLGTGQRKRSNTLVLGTARRHALGRSPKDDLGPELPPSILEL